MGFQVHQATHKILVLVKRYCRMGSQVNPTTHEFQLQLKGVARCDFRQIKLHIKFWFQLKEITRWDLKLTQSHTDLALVKRSQHMRFQVDRAAYKILILVKGDYRIGSQINSTIQGIQLLLKGIVIQNFRLVELQTDRLWFLLKEVTKKDLRLAQPYKELSFC